MRGFDRAEVKQWARTVKTQNHVVQLRKIVCVKCIYFARSSVDGLYHGACHYTDNTQLVRTWSILSCIDRGGFEPKMNVDTEKVRGELNEWIREHDPAVGEM